MFNQETKSIDEVVSDTLTQMSLFTNSSGILTKKMSLVDGRLKKEASPMMYSGVVKTITVESLNQLDIFLKTLPQNQSMGFGITGSKDPLNICLKKNERDGHIGRTRENFNYPDGSAIFAFDYDPEPDIAPLTMTELDEKLTYVVPLMKTVGRLWRPSTSAGVHKIGEPPPEVSGGIHGFIIIKDGKDTKRLAKTIECMLWLNNLGHIKISTSGAMLDRCLTDQAIYTPERLFFEAEPVLGEGLMNTRPESLLIEGGILDSSLITVDDDQITRADELKKAAKVLAKPQADKVKSKARNECINNLSKNTSIVRAKAIANKAFEEQKLSGDFPLNFEDKGYITVKDILSDPDSFHDEALVDPFETHILNSPMRSKFYKNQYSMTINNFAHGGYILELIKEDAQMDVRELGRCVEQIETILASGNRLTVFFRGKDLVKVVGGKVLVLTPITLEMELGKIINPVKWDSKKQELVPCPFPDKIIKALFEKGEWKLPELVCTTKTPFFYDGQVIGEQGYHKDTGTYVCCDSISTPKKLTKRHACEARDRLKKHFSTFPWVSEADQATAIALLISGIQMPVLPNLPIFPVVASCPGTGKTLLVEGISAIITGQAASPMGFTGNEDELNKILVACVRENASFIMFDNLEKGVMFGGSTLCSVATSGRIRGRILGASKTVDLPAKMLITSTANGEGSLKNDITRRCLVSKMDAGLERPEERKFETNFLSDCIKNRQTIIKDVLIILQAYSQSNDELEPKPFGSFEAWSDEVRKPMLWAGMADPVDCKPAHTTDDTVDDLSLLLETWKTLFSHQPRTAKQALENFEFNSFAAEIWYNRSGTGADARRLGKFLAQNAGRIVSGSRMVRDGTIHKVSKWKLESLAA